MASSSKTVKKDRSNPSRLDNKKPFDIKEKTYITRQVESSIALLDSPEDDVVLEALLYLSKYADVNVNHLNYLEQRGLLLKLLNLFNRNVCILRLSLRLLGILLTNDDILTELDQDIYNDKVLKISNMYISHNDTFVRHFCVSILSKLAVSCRINCMIFKIDLFNPILDTIKKTTDMVLLEWTLELLLKLLNAPAAIGILPDIYNFDISILLKHLDKPEKKLAYLSFEVIQKLTSYCLDVFQKMFREAKLIEIMLDVLMNPDKKQFHEISLDIISNSMKSEESSNYFIESLEFLKFCQWVKTCDQDYLFPCVNILEQLTKIPNRRQMLFDLSVEDSILYFLRSTEKNVLNKACEAISNMSTHKYCCERMLTPIVLKELFAILLRKDEEDPGNEVALKTILHFSRRNINTLDMIHSLGFHKILFSYFRKGIGFISEESFLGILEVLYKMSVNPRQQQDIANSHFFEKLMHLFQTAPVDTAIFVCEILTNFVGYAEFTRIFLSLNGPQIFVGTLQTSQNMKLLKIVLIFIHSNLIYENVVRSFIQNNLIKVLKEYPEFIKSKAPLINKILILVYNLHLPLKLFESQRLDITDKLGNKFYLINGHWKGPFPFIEILEAYQVSTLFTIYVVDYTFELIKLGDEESGGTTSVENFSSDRTLSIVSKEPSDQASTFRRSPFQINYGKLSADPFLPRYIYHINKCLESIDALEEKVKILAAYIDSLLCGPKEGCITIDKIHTFKLHIESLKNRLGTNMIPIGFIRLGFHCERALLFKAIADKICIPTSLVKGMSKLYWNEVAILHPERNNDILKLYVVDLMYNIGNLLLIGSREANQYCNIKT